jgi:hypothetical protein
VFDDWNRERNRNTRKNIFRIEDTMQFTITLEVRKTITVDESAEDVEGLVDLLSEKYPDNTILKIVPHPQPLTKEMV